MRNGIGHVGRIPIDDCGDDEIEAGCPILLGLMATIDDTPLSECADCLCESVTLLTFVEARLASTAQGRIFQPIEHKQGAFNLADFLQGDVKLVLPPVGREFPKHR